MPPELGTARRLVERGHHVTVLAEDSMLADVRSTGATFRPWVEAPNRASRHPDDDPYRDWECKSPFALFARLRERQFVGPAPGYAADVTAAIADVRPDLVVCSFFAVGAMAAAEAAGVDFDVLFPNAYLLPAPGVPPVGLGLAPAKSALGRARDRLITSLTMREWDKGVPGLNDLRTSLGLDPIRSFFDQVHRARRELVLTSPDFDFPGDLPPNVRYVGADPRRSRVGEHREVDTSRGGSAARARRSLIHVSGPRRLPAAHRRRHGHAAGARNRHDRSRDRPQHDHRVRQRHSRRGRAAFADPASRRQLSSPMAGTAPSCGPWLPAYRWSCSPMDATRRTTHGVSPRAVPASRSDGPPSRQGSRPQSSGSSTRPPIAPPPNVSERRSAETLSSDALVRDSRPSRQPSRSKGAAYRNVPVTAADHALSGRA